MSLEQLGIIFQALGTLLSTLIYSGRPALHEEYENMNTRHSPGTIAIIGGGIGGLALAAGLIRRHVPVQIYEAAAKFEEVGLGLSIGPAAHRAMPLIDPQIRAIYDKLITTHADSPGYEHLQDTWFEIIWATADRDGGDDDRAGQLLMDLKAPPSGQTTAKRSDFLDALIRLIPPEIAHFGKRLESLVEDEYGVQMRFKDGTMAHADAVVGCDGIHSKVKEFIIPSDESKRVEPCYSGMYCYRAVLDMSDMIAAVGDRRARVSTMYLGHDAYAISYPIMRAQKVNVGLYMLQKEWKVDGDADKKSSWIRPATRADLRKDFAGKGPQMRALSEAIPSTSTSQWAIYDHPPLSTYTRSRIAILGDAAHASTPHQGAGAGQAIEDAHFLAEMLSDAHTSNLDSLPAQKPSTFDPYIAAFKAYDTIRRPRTQEVVRTSKENASLLCLCHEGVGDDGEALKRTFDTRFQWLWNLDLDEEVRKGREIVERLRKG